MFREDKIDDILKDSSGIFEEMEYKTEDKIEFVKESEESENYDDMPPLIRMNFPDANDADNEYQVTHKYELRLRKPVNYTEKDEEDEEEAEDNEEDEVEEAEAEAEEEAEEAEKAE